MLQVLTHLGYSKVSTGALCGTNVVKVCSPQKCGVLRNEREIRKKDMHHDPEHGSGVMPDLQRNGSENEESNVLTYIL